MTPSKYQDAILSWPARSSGNLIVQALAGSGKTKTLELLTRGPLAEQPTIAVAFNASIAKELGSRLPAWVNASTFHSFGNSIIRKGGWVKVNAKKTENILKFEVYDFTIADADTKKEVYGIQNFIIRMVSLLKNHLHIGEVKQDNLLTMAQTYGVDLPKDVDLALSKLKDTWAKSTIRTKVIDFDDMIYLPLSLGLQIPKTKWALVDEVQDLNPAQIAMVTQMGERIICVGDVHQAIYGFRGASATAMETLREKLNADVLPLSISYRCSKAVVAEAQKIVPTIEAAEAAPEGSVSNADFNPKEGDFVLCRVAAPLIKECLRMLAQGKRATVLGRDIGNGLIAFVKQLDCESLEELRNELDAFEAGFKGREDRRIEIEDKCAVIRALADEALSIKDIENKINHLFSEEMIGVTFSTIHKSKGLEADNVWILKPELLPHPRVKEPWLKVQEQNLMYVAITRARHNLIWVNT